MIEQSIHSSVVRRRDAFTLIELVTAMLAATVLLTSLAATVVISTNLLEVPPNDETEWHDRWIVDRLSSDLRYATSVDDTYSYGLQIAKLDPTSGSPVTVTYESYMDGLTRQVDSDPVMTLDPEVASSVHWVDGYSAPTYATPDHAVRVISTSTASTSAAAAFIDVNVPSGCKDGDLVVCCVSAKTPDFLSVSESGWQVMQATSRSSLRLVVIYRFYDSSWASTMRISSSPDSAMAVAMIALENVDPTSPIDWTSTQQGFTFDYLESTQPTYLESSGFDDRQLNLQIYASDLAPWNEGAMGMAGFCDVAQVTAAEGSYFLRNSIGIVARNGAAPTLSFMPRLRHSATGDYLHAAARLEVSP